MRGAPGGLSGGGGGGGGGGGSLGGADAGGVCVARVANVVAVEAAPAGVWGLRAGESIEGGADGCLGAADGVGHRADDTQELHGNGDGGK